MKKLTVFIINCGEDVFEECKASIANQKLPSDLEIIVDVIENVYPMSEAFNEMHRRSETKYFIQVDADMVLKEDAVSLLYDAVKKTPFWIYAVYGQLFEEGFGVGGAIRCWKRGYLSFFKFKDCRTVDRNLFKRTRRCLLRRKNLNKVLGLHKPRHSLFSEYLKTKSDVEKWRFLGRNVNLYALPLMDKFLEEKDHVKLFGLLLGAVTSKATVYRSKSLKDEIEKFESMKSCSYLDLFDLNKGFSSEKLNDIRELFISAYSTYSEDHGYVLLKRVFELYSLPNFSKTIYEKIAK